jgi:hypothetical protein
VYLFKKHCEAVKTDDNDMMIKVELKRGTRMGKCTFQSVIRKKYFAFAYS